MRAFLTVILGLVCCLSTRCQAGVLVTVQAGTVTAGGNGFLEVLISSKDGDTLNIDLANYEFFIEPIGTPLGSLSFGSQISDSSNQYPYFMAGNSIGITRDPSTSNQTLIATELSYDKLGVDLTSQSKLLIRFELVNDVTTAVGEQFRVSLVSGPNTFFESVADPLTGLTTSHDVSSVSGIVTIVAQTQVIPEPISCFIFAGGFATVILCRRRKVARNIIY